MKLYVLFIFPLSAVAELYKHISFFTMTTGIPDLPGFSGSSFIQGKQVEYYDSNGKILIPRQDWIRQIINTKDWTRKSQAYSSASQQFTSDFRTAMESFGHSKGIHTFQRMFGCFWDDGTGYSEGFDVYGYDGKTFISLDLDNMSFIPVVPQAESVTEKWNRDPHRHLYIPHFSTHECVSWLRKFVSEDNDIFYMPKSLSYLNAIVIPTITHFIKKQHILVCHVTSLSFTTVLMYWKENDFLVDEDDMEIGLTLPNGDGTFQKSIYLLLELEDFEENEYTCVLKYQTLTGKTLATITKMVTVSSQREYQPFEDVYSFPFQHNATQHP